MANKAIPDEVNRVPIKTPVLDEKPLDNARDDTVADNALQPAANAQSLVVAYGNNAAMEFQPIIMPPWSVTLKMQSA